LKISDFRILKKCSKTNFSNNFTRVLWRPDIFFNHQSTIFKYYSLFTNRKSTSGYSTIFFFHFYGRIKIFYRRKIDFYEKKICRSSVCSLSNNVVSFFSALLMKLIWCSTHIYINFKILKKSVGLQWEKRTNYSSIFSTV
jgi:hypothetical protein